MPNANKPSGLTPVKTLNGADWDGRGNLYNIDVLNGDILSIGDPVALTGESDPNGIPSIARCAAGATCVGVILAIGTNADGGPYINPNNLSLLAAPAVKLVDYYALVCDDPSVVFEMQETGVLPSLTSAAVGLNANWLAANPPAGSNLSAFMIDNTTEAVGATLNVKLLGLNRKAGNAFGPYAKWLVLINNHQYRAGIAGI